MNSRHHLFSILGTAMLLSLPHLGLAADSASVSVPAAPKSEDKSADTTKANATPAATDKAKPDAATKPANYVLHATDLIAVTVLNDATATGDFRIAQDGTLPLMYLNPEKPLKLAGLTVAEAVKAITQAYADQKIFVHPQVSLTVKEYTARHVNFLGQVVRLGQVNFPVEGSLTLVNAFSQAGGHTGKASRYCKITRLLADGTSQEFTVDLRGAVENAKLDIPLREDDTLFIGESAFGDSWQ